MDFEEDSDFPEEGTSFARLYGGEGTSRKLLKVSTRGSRARPVFAATAEEIYGMTRPRGKRFATHSSSAGQL